MERRTWLVYAGITTIFWGIWGALIEIPEKAGFPATLGYSVWAITMIPCAFAGLYIIKWKLEYDTRSILLGCAVGLSGAGGQLLLFLALRSGPAYIVFPLISLFPVLTIALSMIFLKERASTRSWIGIVIALVAIIFLSIVPDSTQRANDASHGNGWLVLSLLVFVLWGLQAYIAKFSNSVMKAESIYFYMTITALLLIPAALAMTDFSHEINWGFKGPWLAAAIHLLNAIGALTLVYALRYGKAIIVVPMTGLSPLITVALSLVLYGVVPGTFLLIGMGLAMVGIFLLSE